MKRFFLFALVALALASCVSVPSGNVFLGERAVDFRAEHDAIGVGSYEGWFKALSIEVEKNDIELFSMIVIYGDGQRERIDTRLVFDAGTRSRIISLQGGRRHIRSIEFSYKTVGSWLDGRARIRVYGIR